jgi:hypothetical protein
MSKTLISKEEFLLQYRTITDEILDVCELKTHFTSHEICGIVYGILSKNEIQFDMDILEFHEIYLVNSTKSKIGTHYQNVEEIIYTIHDIIHDNI